MSAGPSLADLIRAARLLQEHAARHPLDYSRWTKAQQDYLNRRSKRKLLRMGNRGGKSKVALADVALRARKAHPHRPDWNSRRGPQHQWIVGVSWDQLIPLMSMFRGMLGDDELKSQPNWTEAKGWGKDAPCLVWPDGSTVRWKTTGQQDRMHAGAELDHILIDEPCTDANYRELERRVVSRAGDISLTLTPINAPGPLDWLQDLCTDKIIDDLHYPMTEELFRYADTGELRRLVDGTVLDQDWIKEQERTVLARWRNIILHGDWNETVTDSAFGETFSTSKHVAEFKLDGKEILCLGIDHGTNDFTETAVLVAVDETTEYPSVYVVDCYEAVKNSPAEQDAKAILAMLARHKLSWSKLKKATGDIAHYGGRGKINRKSNQELGYEIARQMGLGRNEALSPPIWTAKTGEGSNPKGSVYRGLSWIHKALLREGQFTIHPRCKSLIESFEKYKGGSTDPHGHLMDALRYGLDTWINRGQSRRRASTTVVFG